MTQLELKKITAKTASEVCSLYELEEETASLLADGLSPSQFLTVLMENNKYPEAAHFIAFALPKREAAWLACLTARNALGDKPTEKELKAIEKAEKWVYKSTEENRQSAMSAAEDAGYNTPAGLAAAAVAWSGGSLAPSGAPAVPPPEDLTAKAVWAAMTLAAFMPDPDKAKDKYRTFISQAIDIANGGSGKAA